MCVCAAVLFSRELPLTSLIWTMVERCGFVEPLVCAGVGTIGEKKDKGMKKEG